MARFDFVTAGESHGPGLTAVVEGMPAGLELDREGLDRDMARRQLGHGRGGRMKIEKDAVEVRSGVRHGRTLGSPIALLVANRDYENWVERMGPWESGEGVEQVHLPRPGHADLAGLQKYGFEDARERARARERPRDRRPRRRGRPRSAVPRGGRGDDPQPRDADRERRGAGARRPRPGGLRGRRRRPRPLPRPGQPRRAMVEEINRLRKENESLGGTFEVRAWGLVPGLGSHVSWAEKLDGRIAQAMVSIQSVKGVSIGPAWEVAASPGSEAHDEIFHSPERGYFRETNRAGGLEGGMTNGEALIVQVAIKPISTLTKPLRSVDVHTKEPKQAHKERTDSTVVPAAGVVGEAMLGTRPRGRLPREVRRRHIDDVRAAIAAYRERIDFGSG